MNLYIEIIDKLREKSATVATMESCTGGSVAGTITNVEGASDVFLFGAVTYSNEYKIKLGVSKKTIDTYTVYSMETAHEMSKAISMYAEADYGIGITGKMGNPDPNNQVGSDQMVYISIYDRQKDIYIDQTFTVDGISRAIGKEQIIRLIGINLNNYLNKR